MAISDTLVLGLDMGTSSVRAMLFDRRGSVVPERETQLGYAQRMTSDGGVDTDPEVLLLRTIDCVQQLMQMCTKRERSCIAGVGVSCFWHSILGVDKAGHAVTPLYSWADARSGSKVPELNTLFDATEYHSVTGSELHPSFWPAKLLWLRDCDTALFDSVARWMSFGEYITLRLFGDAPCSISMASGTGLFNQRKIDWDDTVVSKLPLRRDQLGQLVDRNDALSGLRQEFAQLLPDLKNVPWFPAVGDGACSNIGSAAVASDRIAINVGTSGAMRVIAGTARTVPGLFCYRVDRQNALVGGAFANGGNVYAWEHATLSLDDRAVNSRRMNTMTPDAHGLTILPFWAGERSPGWHMNARATITGMNLHTTPMDIVRASLESVAYTFDQTRRTLQEEYPSATEIVASGGALLHDPTWIQIMADVFGKPIITSKVFEASSRGAALIALNGLGLLPDLSKAPAYLGRTYKPNLSCFDQYARAAQRTQNLYEAMFGIDAQFKPSNTVKERT